VKIDLTYRGGSVQFDCAPEEKILLAGLRAGHGLPHECGTGTCGTCKAALLRGDVEPGWAQAPGRKHLKAGEVLLCQAEAKTDCAVEVRGRLADVAPARPAHLRGTLRRVIALNADVRRLEIALEQPVAFAAGQFMLVQAPGIAGFRGWSMAQFERPASTLVFTVKSMPGGAISRWLIDGDRTGTSLTLFGPMGRALFDPAADKNLLCIAGGSGLAPMLAILQHAAESGHLARHRLDLFFGVRRLADAYALDELMALRDRVPDHVTLTVALSEEVPSRESAERYPEVTFASGFVHAVAGHAMVGRYDNVTAFLAGPPVMVEAAMRHLIMEAKLPARQIRFDKFS